MPDIVAWIPTSLVCEDRSMKAASLGFFAAVLAGGCMKQGDGTIGQADSQSAGTALATEVEDGASGFGPVATDGAGVDGACVTLSGDTADPDGDSIPNNATLTFACQQTQNGYTGMVTGTENVTDTAPNAPTWSFSAEANLHLSLTGPGGASITNDRMGTITGAQSGATFSLDRMLTATTTLKATAAGQGISVDEDNAWTLSYTPMIAWTPGAIVVSGTLSATGSWSVTVGGNSADATLSTPTPLTLTPSCATRVTAGTLDATFDGGGHTNTLAVTWTGCGSKTVTFTAK
jgi:hypothetical protein